MNVCANCGKDIVWMGTLNAWIHWITGLTACDVRRPVLATIFGRSGVRATPSRRPSSN
jgi:hypothetical protein